MIIDVLRTGWEMHNPEPEWRYFAVDRYFKGSPDLKLECSITEFNMWDGNVAAHARIVGYRQLGQIIDSPQIADRPFVKKLLTDVEIVTCEFRLYGPIQVYGLLTAYKFGDVEVDDWSRQSSSSPIAGPSADNRAQRRVHHERESEDLSEDIQLVFEKETGRVLFVHRALFPAGMEVPSGLDLQSRALGAAAARHRRPINEIAVLGVKREELEAGPVQRVHPENRVLIRSTRFQGEVTKKSIT